MSLREMVEKKVFSYMEEYHMAAPGERIVAGVSGGADSVCLFFLLLEYAGKVPLDMAVVHVNHGLRREAGEDAGFVEELCRERGIPFYLTETDVEKAAREEKCSQEDAGRRIRYRAFWQAARRMGGARIAVAHNAGDNAETMLFRLFRGTGLKGLCGIAPVRQEKSLGDAPGDLKAGEMPAEGLWVIRPILCLERWEVEAYLLERGISWRTDATNSLDCYSRNRIRHHILPAAEQVVRGAVGHMCRTGLLLQETEDFLEIQTREALDRCLGAEPDSQLPGQEAVPMGEGVPSRFCLSVEAFNSCHGALQKRMLLDLLKGLTPTGKDIAQVHVGDVLALFGPGGTRSLSLPFGIRARRQYQTVILERGRVSDMEPQTSLDIPIELPSREEILAAPFVYPLGNWGKLEFTAFFIKKHREVPKNRCTKWFDYDKIEKSVVIRSRRQGDFLTILDGAGKVRHKSLKEYMIGEKIPRQQRDQIPLVAAGEHILWVVGRRASEAYRVDGETECVLQVKLENGPGGAE